MNTESYGSTLDRILDILRPLVVNGPSVYLIGGAVRDLLLKRPAHDLDFAMPEDVRRVARATADALDGAFYMLDDERSTARVIFNDAERGRFVLDFATLRAGTLEGDLRARDFTINAIAMDVTHSQELIDPLHGAQDLKDQYLRMCTPQSFNDDPVRVLRGVRQSLSYQFKILPDTWHAMQAAAPQLDRVSMERKRDEIFRMAESPCFSSALRMMDQLGVLEQLFPECVQLKGLKQRPPHIFDAWEHTLAVVKSLEILFAVLVDEHQEDDVASLLMGMAASKLGRFRPELAEFYEQELVPGRPLRGLLKLAGLLHDNGKVVTRSVDENGKLHFIGHDTAGAKLAAQRGIALTLSKEESARLKRIVEGHMLLHFLSKDPLLVRESQPEGKRNVYRFLRKSGAAGIDICLLSLADVMAAYGPELPVERWLAELEVVEAMFSAWFEKYDQIVSPPRQVTGKDLMRELRVKPGKRMGELLNAIEEAQACGEVADREQVMAFARAWLEEEG
jgi:poly(A) polymerase